MQSQTENTAPKKNQASRAPVKADKSESPERSEKQEASHEIKTVGDVIGESLGKDTQKQLEEAVSQASDMYKTGKKYVNENRGEALALFVAVGVAGWALLYTKPGRQIFDMAAPKVLPQISALLTETLGVKPQNTEA